MDLSKIQISNKFPSTPHLATLSGVEVRDDKVMSETERNEFLSNHLVIEEKIDGANLGISFNMDGDLLLQNRGSYLYYPYIGQWKKLNDWISDRIDTLMEHLFNKYILFGEWCYAQHSVSYDKLPDWFIAFDVYDKRYNRFMSIDNRNALLKKMNIECVPVLGSGQFTFEEVKNFISTSKLGNQDAEGIYLRFDKKEWLIQRSKLVRPAFVQSIESHWSRSAIRPNKIIYRNKT